MAMTTLKDGVIDVSRTVREAQPAHYLFKIESFSVILEENIEKLESDDFEVGDYKWTLIIRANGKEDANGTGYISLYLAIKDTDKLPQGWELNVRFKFFVYNHIEDNYLTIKDAGEKTRRFHAVKMEWGFSQLISLEEFNDASNGYLCQDSCVFGTEIYVIKSSAKGECISLIKKPTDRYFTWRVNNFSSIADNFMYSEEFDIQGEIWKLKLFPRGSSKARGESLSLFLCVATPSNSPRHRVYTKYRLSIIDQISNKACEKEAEVWFYPTVDNWGFHRFIELSVLKDSSKGYLVNDALIVKVEVFVISAVKNLN